jgi:hypothetical protein
VLGATLPVDEKLRSFVIGTSMSDRLVISSHALNPTTTAIDKARMNKRFIKNPKVVDIELSASNLIQRHEHLQ